MEKSISQKNWSISSPPTLSSTWLEKKVQRKLHDKETDINASEEEPQPFSRPTLLTPTNGGHETDTNISMNQSPKL